MMRYYILIFSLFFLSLVSCTSEKKEIKAYSPKVSELNHHIINDSIEYKIIEIELKNEINRKLCIYKKDTLITEIPVYKVKKKVLQTESYYVEAKKQYLVENETEILISDYRIHFNNYKIDHTDTVINRLIINEFGEHTFDSLRIF